MVALAATVFAVTVFFFDAAPAAADYEPGHGHSAVCSTTRASSTTTVVTECDGGRFTGADGRSHFLASDTDGSTWSVWLALRADTTPYTGATSVSSQLCVAFADNDGTRRFARFSSTYNKWTTDYETTTGVTAAAMRLNEDGTYIRTVEYWFRSDAVGADPGTVCRNADPGPPPPPVVEEVAIPAVHCQRTFRESGGYTFADLTATVLNPSAIAGVTDTVQWRTSWDTEWLTDRRRTVQVPDMGTMPAGGWKAMCRVTRTFTESSTVKGSTSYEDEGATTTEDVSSDEAFTNPVAPTKTLWFTGIGKKLVTFGSGVKATLGGLLVGAGLNWAVTNELERKELQAQCRQAVHELANAGVEPEEDVKFCPIEQAEGLRQQTQLRTATGTVVTAGTWTVAEVRAEVLIDPLRPEKGTTQIVAQETPQLTTEQQATLEAQADTSEKSGCDRSWWQQMLPWNIADAIGCVLRKLFIPATTTVTAWWTTVRGLFPFTVVDEMHGAITLFLDRLDNQAASSCLVLDFRHLPQNAGPEFNQGNTEALRVAMPTPTGSGCLESATTGVDSANNVGDLFGYRELVRNLLLVALWVAVALKIANTYAPKDVSDTEPIP